MAKKYQIEWSGVDGTEYTVEIHSDSFVGSSTDVVGSAVFGQNTLTEIDEPIRSKYLRLSLYATAADDFEDLILANEREYSVIFKRGSDTLFFGYLTSEGVIQSYRTMERYIEFDVLDPLAFLEDLAYVDSSGLTYEGDEQTARIIAKCLQRAFNIVDTPFNISTYIPYDYRTINISTGTTTDYTAGRFIKDTVINQDQWIDTDSGEVVSCMEILKELLSSLQLCITQINGDTWLIYHYFHDMSGIDAKYINDLDSDGDDIADLGLAPFSTEPLITDNVNATTELIHCNENQQYEFIRGLQELTLDHEFRFSENIIKNKDFEGGVTGVSMPDWATGGDYSEARDNGTLRIFTYDPGVNTNNYAANSTTEVGAGSGSLLKLVGEIEAINFTESIFYFQIELQPYAGGDSYYLGFFGNESPIWWQQASPPTSNIPVFGTQDEIVSFEYELPPTPVDGVLTLTIHAANKIGGPPPYSSSTYIAVHSLNLEGQSFSRVGTTYKFRNTDVETLKAEKTETYFDTGRITAVDNIFRKLSIGDPVYLMSDVEYSANFFELGKIKNRNYLTSRETRILFSGDVYGFFEPHKYLELADLTSNDFIVKDYSFDTVNNVVSIEIEERRPSGLNSSGGIFPIYAEVIEPTIK